MASNAAADAPPEGARCSLHPDAPAQASCQRCGAFICAQDVRAVDERPFCATCAARPDVDYLEAHRQRAWGRRSGWAWLIGLGGILSLVQSGLGLGSVFSVSGQIEPLRSARAILVLLLGGVSGANSILFWFGRPIARPGLVIFAILGVLPLFFSDSGAEAAPVAVARLIGLGLIFAVLADVRTKLFFKLEVSRKALRRDWDVTHNNPMAQRALAVALLGLLVPGVSLAAIAMGTIGLARFDPKAIPPVGYRGRAIAGLAIGIAGLVFWAAMIARTFVIMSAIE